MKKLNILSKALLIALGVSFVTPLCAMKRRLIDMYGSDSVQPKNVINMCGSDSEQQPRNVIDMGESEEKENKRMVQEFNGQVLTEILKRKQRQFGDFEGYRNASEEAIIRAARDSADAYWRENESENQLPERNNNVVIPEVDRFEGGFNMNTVFEESRKSFENENLKRLTQVVSEVFVKTLSLSEAFGWDALKDVAEFNQLRDAYEKNGDEETFNKIVKLVEEIAKLYIF